MSMDEQQRIQNIHIKLNTDGSDKQKRKITIIQTVTAFPECTAAAHKYLDKKGFVTFIRSIDPGLPSLVGSPVVCFILSEKLTDDDKMFLLLCNLIMRLKLSIIINGGNFADSIWRRIKTDSLIMLRCTQTQFLVDADKKDALSSGGLIDDECNLVGSVTKYSKDFVSTLDAEDFRPLCRVLEDLGCGKSVYKAFGKSFENVVVDKKFTSNYAYPNPEGR